MMEIRRVLFPTEFSAVSEGALPYAGHIADTHGSELHLLHVNLLDEDDPYVVGQSLSESETQRTATNAWATEELNRLAEDPALKGVEVIREVAWDVSAADLIAEYVGDKGISLVVMGTHGEPGARNWLGGSVASEVIRTAPSSVLAVPYHGQVPRAPSFRRILVPVDFSDFSKEGLSVACELTLGYGAQLELLHVLGNKGRSVNYPDSPEVGNGSRIDSVPQGELTLSSFFREVGAGLGIPAKFNVRQGNAGLEIVRFAEIQGCDLIVMGSLGLTGIDRFLLGSTAERVIAGAPCPVLVVKPGGRSLLA